LYLDNFYDIQLEDALDNVTVQLFEASDLSTAVQTTMTTSNGYTFENLDSNTAYVVGIVLPDGLEYVVKQDPTVPNSAYDSDVDEMTGLSDEVTPETCAPIGVNIGLKPE